MPDPTDLACRDYRADTQTGGDDRPMCLCGWGYTAHYHGETVNVERYMAHLEELYGRGDAYLITVDLPDDMAAAADLARKYDKENE